MQAERCLYTLIHAPRESHDALLLELVAPVAREVRGSPELHSLFFVRYREPEWQLRFRILGAASWVEGPVREEVSRRLEPLRARGLLERWEFATYERETERYGGERGMRLCERMFMHDSVACLDLLEAERRGLAAGSRREYSVVLVERFLDLMRFDRAQRVEFYRRGYGWAVDGGDWREEDLRVLEERYRSLKRGLLALFRGGREDDPDAAFGGAEPARIARACLTACAPIVEELLAAHETGELRQDLVYLAGSLAHMHCNRLGLDVSAEAILRFFMHRLHQDENLL